MTTFSFNQRFVPPILAKTKTLTIRRVRADGFVPRTGGPIHLVCGYRTKQAVRLGQAVAVQVQPVTIDWVHSWVDITQGRKTRRLDCWDSDVELHPFARSAGFKDWPELWDYFVAAHGKEVFDGIIISWADTFEPVTNRSLRGNG